MRARGARPTRHGNEKNAEEAKAAKTQREREGAKRRGVAFFAIFASFASFAFSSQPSLSSGDRDFMIAMLRDLRDDVAKHYYDPRFHGVDLAARFRDAELRLKTTTSFNDGIATLAEFLTQLDDSHTTFIPPNRRVRVDYGWQMAIVGRVPLIVDVDRASDAAAKGLAPGDRVLLLNTFEPTRGNLWRLLYFYRFIGPQAQQRVAVLKPDGSARTVDVASKVETKPITELGDLVAELERDIDRSRDVGAALAPDVFVWKMRMFGSPAAVDEMIAKARGSRTLVLDLRGNGGGAVAALRELVSRTFDREIVVAQEKLRDKTTRETAKPARSRFDGRLIVLVDSRSASAAEMFARIVQIEKRGTVLGDRTSGQVMTSRIFPHQFGVGAALAFYAVSVTVGDVRMSDGESLEKVGVEPDEIVLPSAADLAASRDPVLARAIELAGGSITPEQAGRMFK